jgi:hypothetical protein
MGNMNSIALCGAAMIAATCATTAQAKKPPEISALALQQMQAREFEVSKIVSFPAVITILQDSGYRIQAADKDTGLITATASTKSNMTWVPFVGFGRSKKTPIVSVFVEDRGAGSRVRFNFVMAKTKNQAYGIGWSDEEPILDAEVYRSAFERLEKEIFVRQSLSTPVQSTAAAASPGTQAPSGATPVSQ